MLLRWRSFPSRHGAHVTVELLTLPAGQIPGTRFVSADFTTSAVRELWLCLFDSLYSSTTSLQMTLLKRATDPDHQ